MCAPGHWRLKSLFHWLACQLSRMSPLTVIAFCLLITAIYSIPHDDLLRNGDHQPLEDVYEEKRPEADSRQLALNRRRRASLYSYPEFSNPIASETCYPDGNSVNTVVVDFMEQQGSNIRILYRSRAPDGSLSVRRETLINVTDDIGGRGIRRVIRVQDGFPRAATGADLNRDAMDNNAVCTLLPARDGNSINFGTRSFFYTFDDGVQARLQGELTAIIGCPPILCIAPHFDAIQSFIFDTDETAPSGVLHNVTTFVPPDNNLTVQVLFFYVDKWVIPQYSFGEPPVSSRAAVLISDQHNIQDGVISNVDYVLQEQGSTFQYLYIIKGNRIYRREYRLRNFQRNPTLLENGLADFELDPTAESSPDAMIIMNTLPYVRSMGNGRRNITSSLPRRYRGERGDSEMFPRNRQSFAGFRRRRKNALERAVRFNESRWQAPLERRTRQGIPVPSRETFQFFTFKDRFYFPHDRLFDDNNNPGWSIERNVPSRSAGGLQVQRLNPAFPPNIDHIFEFDERIQILKGEFLWTLPSRTLESQINRDAFLRPRLLRRDLLACERQVNYRSLFGGANADQGYLFMQQYVLASGHRNATVVGRLLTCPASSPRAPPNGGGNSAGSTSSGLLIVSFIALAIGALLVGLAIEHFTGVLGRCIGKKTPPDTASNAPATEMGPLTHAGSLQPSPKPDEQLGQPQSVTPQSVAPLPVVDTTPSPLPNTSPLVVEETMPPQPEVVDGPPPGAEEKLLEESK